MSCMQHPETMNPGLIKQGILKCYNRAGAAVVSMQPAMLWCVGILPLQYSLSFIPHCAHRTAACRYRVFAMDLRGHGSSTTADDADLSAEVSRPLLSQHRNKHIQLLDCTADNAAQRCSPFSFFCPLQEATSCCPCITLTLLLLLLLPCDAVRP